MTNIDSSMFVIVKKAEIKCFLKTYENIQIKYLGLVVLNAEDLVELGRVEFELPGPVPKPLHGCFLPTWDYSPVI